MKRVLAILGCAFLLAGTVWGYPVDDDQNSRIGTLENKLKKMEDQLRKQQNAAPAPLQPATQTPVVVSSPAVAALENRIATLESKNAALEARVAPKASSGPKISGMIQVLYGETDDAATNAKMSFAARRVRLIMNGSVIPEKITYTMQADMVSNPSILDAVIRAYYIPRTELSFGRFIPAFSHYMPASSAKLDFINYPLVVNRYGMFRQAGIQSSTKFENVDINVGVFNGYPANNNGDNNSGKDLLAGTTLRLAPGLSLLGYSWFGNLSSAARTDPRQDRYGGGVLYDIPFDGTNKISLKSEYIAGYDRSALGAETCGAGMYAQAGLQLRKKVEFMVRYEQFDPNFSADSDSLQWFTGGINYLFAGYNAMVYLNYIHKLDERKPDPRDDELALQLQVSF